MGTKISFFLQSLKENDFLVMRVSFKRPPLSRLFPLLCLVTFLLALWFNSPQAIAQQPLSEIRGVWMTSNDMDTLRDRSKMQAAVNRLQQLHFNTIYPVIWNAGYATYPSQVVQDRGIQSFVYKGMQDQDILAELIDYAHAQGLLVIPWFEFGFMAPPSSELAMKYSNWLTEKQDGSQTSISAAGEVVWLNPLRPDVQQFITDLVMEVVSNYDADGIQFDDHMSLPNEFGYDRYTVDLYTRETKKAPPSNPRDAAWVKWRADKITEFMAKLNKAIKAQKPKAFVSVSPNYYDFAYNLTLQDWLTWVRRNLVDELLVQVYREDLNSFVAQINRPEIQESQGKISTGIGVLSGLRNKPVSLYQIQSQVRAAQERGLGVSFFYYESLWDKAPEPPFDRLSGFQALFPGPAPRSTVQ